MQTFKFDTSKIVSGLKKLSKFLRNKKQKGNEWTWDDYVLSNQFDSDIWHIICRRRQKEYELKNTNDKNT